MTRVTFLCNSPNSPAQEELLTRVTCLCNSPNSPAQEELLTRVTFLCNSPNSPAQEELLTRVTCLCNSPNSPAQEELLTRVTFLCNIPNSPAQEELLTRVTCLCNSPTSPVQEEGRKEMFYLTTHSTHFIYGYMASDIWLRTILIVRKETHCRHIGYSFRLTARVLLYAPSHRQDSTYHDLCYTSRGALLERETAKWVHPMKDRSDDPSHHEGPRGVID